MPDVFTAAERSRIMGRIRSRGNKTTELRLIEIFRRYKMSGWRREMPLFGRPDFIFAEQKIAVFIDGDFWHGNPATFRMPKSNQSYWRAKIERNKQRDKLVSKTLKKSGWRVIRIWESALRNESSIARKLRCLRTEKNA